MRNDMHSFAATPQANIPRSRFDMPFNTKFTGNAGDLIPFYVQEVLPGDTFDVSTSLVCRLQTLIHPIFDNIVLDTYYFFVPNRLVWDNWKHFMGEPNKAWVPDQEWTIPKINVPIKVQTANENRFGYYGDYKDSIIDYMGVGLTVTDQVIEATTFPINAIPIRAYNKIYDDWFRDENLEDPINLYTGDNDLSWILPNGEHPDSLIGGPCRKAAKLHDYFTSALPQAQRGEPATLTVGGVGNIKLNTTTNYYKLSNPLQFVHSGSTPGQAVGGNVRINSDKMLTSGLTTGGDNVDQINLYLPFAGQSLGITVNDLRMAFQVQKFMERSARGGARYIEIIKSMFGVESPDARLQRSEYLGGHRVPINIHQIVNTSESIDSPLGNVGAMSVTSDVHKDFIHSFTEHGYVLGICTVRYKHSYAQGMDKHWLRNTRFDYYWPVFAHIGEQPVKNIEIYSGGNIIENSRVFGYQEAWSEYKHKPNRVAGEMRPGVPNTLASWTLSDYYTSQPTLSESWIKEDKMPIDRAIAVTSAVADQFLFDIMVNCKSTRPMPLYSIPGLVDHF